MAVRIKFIGQASFLVACDALPCRQEAFRVMMGTETIRFNVLSRETMQDNGSRRPIPAKDGLVAASRSLSPPARRALEEAQARRLEIEQRIAALPPEKGGRGGVEPVRYGDWEVKGLATDF
jgi:hypothetical protein